MNIALIGPRGVGKSKVSRKLSKLTSMPIISTDMIAVYEQGGISIPERIKNDNGSWQEFRKLETSILEKLKSSNEIIIDCGGGIIFDVDDNGVEFYSHKKVELIKSFCTIVALNRDFKYLLEKVVNDSTRPSLNQSIRYEEILKRRLPFYKIASQHYLNIEGLEVEEVTEHIKEILSL